MGRLTILMVVTIFIFYTTQCDRLIADVISDDQVGRYALIGGDKTRYEIVNRPLEELSNEQKQINRSYIKSLIKGMNNNEKISFLINKLKDPTQCYLVREFLIETGKMAIKPLHEIVRDKKINYIARSEALIVLKELRDKTIISTIEDEIKPTSAYEEIHAPEIIRFQKAYLEIKLMDLKQNEKLNVLIKMLKDEKKSRLARDALIEIGTPSVALLIKVLEDKKNTFLSRLDAMWCLASIKDERRIKPIINVLLDEDETDHLRESAAYILGVIKDKSAIPALEKVIKTWKPKPNAKVITVIKTGEKIYANDVKRAAEKALEQIKSQEKIKDKKEEK